MNKVLFIEFLLTPVLSVDFYRKKLTFITKIELKLFYFLHNKLIKWQKNHFG